MRILLPQHASTNPVKHLADHYAHELVTAGLQFSAATYFRSSLSLREFECARIRTAQINGCHLCQAWRTERDVVKMYGSESGIRGELPDAIFHQSIGSDWRNSSVFSDRERLAIEYAEGVGLSPDGIANDDAFWDRMKRAYSDEEVVDLSFCLAAWIGLGRAIHVLGLDTVCALELAAVDALEGVQA
jgi:alkylhydroperoxidase family enzyme